jgi:1-acyl-sn-glycerol-3-phosphate acyltransferase
MNILKQILGRIYALYALIIFIILLAPAYLYFVCVHFFINKKNKEFYFHQGFKNWMALYMPLIFCPITHKGSHNFKQHQNYVVIINHNSLMDIPVSSPGIISANKTLGKSSFSNIPMFGFIYKCGSILVDRKSSKSRADSYGKMLSVLAQGMHLCLYPEGTRNKTNLPLQAFHDGAFKIAIASGKPIMPAIIYNTNKILPANGPVFWAWPHRIIFEFMTPIATNNILETDIKILKEKCWQIMHDKIFANENK